VRLVVSVNCTELLTFILSTDLKVLILQRVWLVEILPCSFSQVLELTCFDVTSISPSVKLLLTPSTFPRLKALAFRRIVQVGIAAEILPSLYSQLACLVVLNPQRQHGIPLHLVPPTCAILGDFTWLELNNATLTTSILPYAFKSARISVTDGEAVEPPTAPAIIQSIAAILTWAQTNTFRLSLLYLPTRLAVHCTLHPSLRSTFEQLLAVCRTRRVQVDFEDSDLGPAASRVSHKFLAYAEETMARRMNLQ
jgi:hypothetical protein